MLTLKELNRDINIAKTRREAAIENLDKARANLERCQVHERKTAEELERAYAALMEYFLKSGVVS